MTCIIDKIKTLSVTQKLENKYIGEPTKYLLENVETIFLHHNIFCLKKYYDGGNENNTRSSNIDYSKMKNSWKNIENTMIQVASKNSKKKYNLETHNAVVEALFTQIIKKKNDNNDDIILHNKLLKDVAYLFISPKKSIKKFKNSKKNNHRSNKYKRHRFHREKYPLRGFYRKM